MTKPKITWEWKLNPAVLLAIILAATGAVAGFVRADAMVKTNTGEIEDNAELLKSIDATQRLAGENNATLLQWQKEQDRRIERLEDGS